MPVIQSVQQLVNDSANFKLSFILFFVALWLIAAVVIVAAKRLRKDDSVIVPEYEPPQDISPVFARYIVTSGRMGGVSGEISVTGMQLLTLISLFERGLLKECSFIDENTVRYVINENYKQMQHSTDEVLFLDELSVKIGMSGTLNETMHKREAGGNGYDQLGSVWLNFWGNILHTLAVEGGYMKKSNGLCAIFLQWFSASLTFGVFISFFVSLIPIIGPVISGLIVFPVLSVFVVCYGLVFLMVKILPVTMFAFVGTIPTIAIFIALFLSWFAWWLIYGQNVTKLVLRLTPVGLGLVRKIEGYKMYLKTVDLDRLSFDFNRENDLSRNRTTFSWLGIFSIAKDSHWDQWHSISEYKQKTTEVPLV